MDPEETVQTPSEEATQAPEEVTETPTEETTEAPEAVAEAEGTAEEE